MVDSKDLQKKNEKPDSSELPNKKKWIQKIQKSKFTLWILAALSFAETFVVPVPIEVIFLPLLLMNRHRIWLLALFTTLGCLIGSIFCYGIGLYVFETTGQWLIETLNLHESYNKFEHFFNKYGFWAILAFGIAPLPFQIAMLFAGATHYPFALFVLATVISRGSRYFGLALLVKLFGKYTIQLWEKNKIWAGVLILVLIVLIFFIIKWLQSML